MGTDDFSDSWGICTPPPARLQNRPLPEIWTRNGAGYGGTVRTAPTEPTLIPAMDSPQWRHWEPIVRIAFCRTDYAQREHADRWRCQALHPDDQLLIELAAMAWNGDTDPSGRPQPRAWKYCGLHTWWILELPEQWTHEMAREAMRRRTGAG